VGESSAATYNADVYVFCVQTATTHEDYDPLDVGQWNFYVLPRTRAEALSYKSLGLATLTAAAGPPVPYARPADHIDQAYETSNESSA
jgi:hypothetical protein